MIVTTLAEPAAEPVGLAEAKAFLRVTGAGEDGLVGDLVAAARAAIEDAVGLALISRTLRVTLDGWPMVLHSRRRMTLPVRPAVSTWLDSRRAWAGRGGFHGCRERCRARARGG